MICALTWLLVHVSASNSWEDTGFFQYSFGRKFKGLKKIGSFGIVCGHLMWA
jgi:hypothetical protein